MNHRILYLVASLLLTGCAGVKHEIAESSARNMEFQLHEAGFKILLADTQERQNLLTRLPSGKISRLPMGGTVYYMYPDPVVCSCLYVGRDQEMMKLQKLAVDMQRSNQALLIHEIGENEQAQWGPSGPWGNNGMWAFTNPNSMGRPAYDPE
jgi:hypothetical protein